VPRLHRAPLPLRTPRSDGRWTRALKDVEARLLTQLDLLFALSEPFDTKPAPPLLRDEALDLLPLVRRSESSMEPGRTFADTLVLACARDPRLVRAAVWGARGVSVDLYEAYADALALGVSPHVDDALAELCLEDDERTLSLALDVAWRRRAVTVGPVLTCLYHASPAIRLRAARALGASHHPEAAAKALDARLAVERSPSVIAAILESMVRLHAPHADEHVHRALVELVRLGAEVDDEHREARLTLGKLSAAIGRVHDVNVFVGASTHAREIECLGWFGRATVPRSARRHARGAREGRWNPAGVRPRAGSHHGARAREHPARASARRREAHDGRRRAAAPRSQPVACPLRGPW
jgi:hypothetical protein